MAILLAALLVAYLWRFEPAIWHRNRSVLLFFLALVVSAVAMRVAADRTLLAFVVPTSATVLLHRHPAAQAPGRRCAAARWPSWPGVMNRDALELTVYVLAGGMAALLAITRAERLNAFVRVFVALAASERGRRRRLQPARPARHRGGRSSSARAGIVNAVLSVVLAVGSFAVLGNVFGIMTVFQMLELANPSNRLLRRLLLETPGTYHHSVMVGNLAERAAETIGADPLLARVAAYYHDIGKMKNPLAFIENQAGAHNIHDDLHAETSARIIAGHIRDGIDLGYEHGLPVQVIGFIPQHHGTSVMSYFHGKALREVGGREDLVDERIYRYPGPQAAEPRGGDPHAGRWRRGIGPVARREGRGVASAPWSTASSTRGSRTASSTTRSSRSRTSAQIKDAFVGQLLGMYHSRIKYPDNVVPMERREQA